MSINAIGTNIPIQVSKGGLGVGTETQFGVLYGNGTAAVGATAVGTAGNVLTSNGAGVAPTFQPVGSLPGAGAWSLIQTQTASSSASLNFTTGLTTFPTLIFILTNILATTPNAVCQFGVSNNGGASYVGLSGSVAYMISGIWNTYNTGAGVLTPMSPPSMPTTGSGLTGTYYFYGNNGTASSCKLRGEWGLGPDQSGNYDFGLAQSFPGIGYVANSYQIIMSAGNIASGTISLYGLSI